MGRHLPAKLTLTSVCLAPLCHGDRMPDVLLTPGLKLTEADQELYKNFPLVISERWQTEVRD